ncbi:MAG TPA: hypothetical protein VHZ51_13435 [Ktedonobacteraceae bacterium]|jgi:hypothetical protein|nr:hypothetical protein [Ktedonobacteraceae bacterium]
MTEHNKNRNTSYFFNGNIRSDGGIAGNYCVQDQGGQCIGNYGLWTVTPQK